MNQYERMKAGSNADDRIISAIRLEFMYVESCRQRASLDLGPVSRGEFLWLAAAYGCHIMIEAAVQLNQIKDAMEEFIAWSGKGQSQ